MASAEIRNRLYGTSLRATFAMARSHKYYALWYAGKRTFRKVLYQQLQNVVLEIVNKMWASNLKLCPCSGMWETLMRTLYTSISWTIDIIANGPLAIISMHGQIYELRTERCVPRPLREANRLRTGASVTPRTDWNTFGTQKLAVQSIIIFIVACQALACTSLSDTT